MNARYIIGIDLGTTNSALAYVDTEAEATGETPSVSVLPVTQLIAPGETEARATLPSFLYLPEAHAASPEHLRLPWSDGETASVEPGGGDGAEDVSEEIAEEIAGDGAAIRAGLPASASYAVGAWARGMARETPEAVVASAKSWLCVDTVDRLDAILPYHRTPPPRRVSPVAALTLYLLHLRAVWDHAMADGASDGPRSLARQEIHLTVPASFDAVARELTVRAAAAAGLTARLVEEPQAAFHAWLHDQGEAWRDQLAPGDTVLVCDIGGGTTDFTLIAASDRDGALALERCAVGDHILLGGDNMDLRLAYGVAEKLSRERNVTLDPRQLAALTHACREAKESEEAGARALTILGAGSGVVAGTIRAELTETELYDWLLDGFFPLCAADAQPAAKRKAGLRAFGLDYASDPAVTRHLAAFLARSPARPTKILFNGGVSKSARLRERIQQALAGWGVEAAALAGGDPDLAVARGAAVYGQTRRGGGVRIKAGSARSYYIGVESAMPAVPGFAPPVEALCVAPFGLEEGCGVGVPAEGVGLVVGEETEFQCFSSTRRREDEPGTRLAAWGEEELEPMPPLSVHLPAEAGKVGSLVPVDLRAELTEVGTLQLWCEDASPVAAAPPGALAGAPAGNAAEEAPADGAESGATAPRGARRRWKLEFELRGDGGD